MFPRLERFDVEFDLPEEFLPEFPPAIFLQNRPELGDVSRGAGGVAQQLPRAVQGDPDPGPARRHAAAAHAVPAGGVQPDRRPQESAAAAWASPASTATSTATPPASSTSARTSGPQERRFRLDTVSLRGRVQPADPRLEAEPALGRGLHRVRAADGLLQRRPDPAP